MYNPYSLIGKKIFVTGASSGIGRAIAIECSKLGAELIITGRKSEELNKTFGQLAGSNHAQFPMDITNEQDVNSCVENLPVLNGMVNAAGAVKTLPFQFIKNKDFSDLLDINLVSPVLLTQKLVKTKKINNNSSIVFISSIDGPVISHHGNSMYAATKGAVSSILRAMALELASKKIRVNGVLPGMVETPLIHTESITSEQLNAEVEKYPLKRIGQPEDVAFAAIYLLSDASSWITGTNLVIDGGFTLI